MLKFRNRRGGVELKYSVALSSVQGGVLVEASESTMDDVPMVHESVLLSPMDAASFAADVAKELSCRPVGKGEGKTASSARLKASVLGLAEQHPAEFVGGASEFALSVGQVEMVVPSFVVRTVGKALDDMAGCLLFPSADGCERDYP